MAQLGLQKVDTNLATNGLGAFELPTVQEDMLGVSGEVVMEACEILRQKAGKIDDLKAELETAKNALLDGSWTGQAADEFAVGFEEMLTAFAEIVPCVQSLAGWAESTTQSYDTADKKTAERIQSALHM